MKYSFFYNKLRFATIKIILTYSYECDRQDRDNKILKGPKSYINKWKCKRVLATLYYKEKIKYSCI